MKNKSTIALMMIIMSVFFTSCSGFEEIQLTQVKELKVLDFSSGTIEFSVDAEIYNPNSFGVNIKGAELDIKLEGIDLGKTQLGESFKIKGNSKETHQINFNLDISKLSLNSIPKIISLATSGGREVNVEVDGTIKGGAFFIHKTFPVNLKQKVPLQL